MPTKYELPPETLDSIRARMIDMNDLEQLLMKGKSGGFEVDNMLQGVKDAKRKLQKIRDSFYPGQSL
jgi:hypothetical protein